MYFFTSDEHFGHKNIIKYCNRPFDSVREMDEEIIKRHNEVVTKNDIVFHAGDFTLIRAKYKVRNEYINRLNGSHYFIKGSHDYWMPNNEPYMHEEKICGKWIVICHYAMRVWAKSHYNSWQLYGHSHGNLEPQGKQWDIGVDNNNFYPVSFDQLKEIMDSRPNNFNLVKKGEK